MTCRTNIGDIRRAILRTLHYHNALLHAPFSAIRQHFATATITPSTPSPPHAASLHTRHDEQARAYLANHWTRARKRHLPTKARTCAPPPPHPHAPAGCATPHTASHHGAACQLYLRACGALLPALYTLPNPRFAGTSYLLAGTSLASCAAAAAGLPPVLSQFACAYQLSRLPWWQNHGLTLVVSCRGTRRHIITPSFRA